MDLVRYRIRFAGTETHSQNANYVLPEHNKIRLDSLVRFAGIAADSLRDRFRIAVTVSVSSRTKSRTGLVTARIASKSGKVLARCGHYGIPEHFRFTGTAFAGTETNKTQFLCVCWVCAYCSINTT